MTDLEFMEQAIRLCRQGVEAGQAPFGAVVVRDGQIVAGAHNQVQALHDPSAHGEIQAMRAACHAAGSTDLAGTTLYTTCEPCPMCLAAILWARVDRVVFGATIGDAARAGFHQFPLEAARLASLCEAATRVEQGPLRERCAEDLRAWMARKREG